MLETLISNGPTFSSGKENVKNNHVGIITLNVFSFFKVLSRNATSALFCFSFLSFNNYAQFFVSSLLL